MTREEFVDLLKYMIMVVEADDSMQGRLEYEWRNRADDGSMSYNVSAAIRSGNTMGQGSITIIEEWSKEAEDGA